MPLLMSMSSGGRSGGTKYGHASRGMCNLPLTPPPPPPLAHAPPPLWPHRESNGCVRKPLRRKAKFSDPQNIMNQQFLNLLCSIIFTMISDCLYLFDYASFLACLVAESLDEAACRSCERKLNAWPSPKEERSWCLFTMARLAPPLRLNIVLIATLRAGAVKLASSKFTEILQIFDKI